MGGLVGGLFGQQQRPGGMQQMGPWGPQVPYLLEGFKRARGMLDRPPEMSPEMDEALKAMYARAKEGSPLNDAAKEQAMKTLQGDYLYGSDASNKAIDATVKDTMNRVMPSLDSKFASGGRYGSGLHKQALGQKIADTSAGMHAKNYAMERQNQMRAGSMAPMLANQDYVDLSRMMQVGGMRDKQLNWQDQRLKDYMGLVGGNYGGTQMQHMYRSPFAGMLGGAMGGGAMFGPWGALGGGLLGLLG